MNIVFLSFDGQTCIQTWSEDESSLYYLLEKKHSATWTGEKQYAEVEKFHRSIYGTNSSFIPFEYAQLFGKLLSDIINQACYDLVICCKEISLQYILTDTPIISMNDTEKWTDAYISHVLSEIRENMKVYIPVYVINMKGREDRRRSIINEFEGKSEFELHLLDACVHRKGAIGLWNSMVRIIRMAKESKEDYVLICEDDHFFTENYSPKLLIREIRESFFQGAEVLSGGIGGFGKGFPAGFHRYWVDWFWCTQFIVVYTSLFDKILSYEFKEEDVADEVISALAINKMVIYPFISEQKDFGYSDVTQSNDENKGLIRNLFDEASDKFEKIDQSIMKYMPILRFITCIVYLFLPSILNAQSVFKIEGRLIGIETQGVENHSINTPLESVNIVLLRHDSTFLKGSLSDRRGYFNFMDIAKGDYLLKFSYIGYETVLIALKDFQKDLRVEDITLSRKNTELMEVTVQGNPIIRKIDRIIVYPTKEAIKHSYDPYDVIAHMMIPRLHANRVGKTLETDGGEVQIRINGIKASQEELMAIPARDILKIEVIDNPGMKYGNENIGAVVDVVVKRRTTGGLVNLGGEFCPYRLFSGYNFSTKLNYKRSQWGFYYDNTLRDLKKIRKDADEIFNLEKDNDIHRIQKGIDGRTRHNLHNVSLTYNYSNPDSYMMNIAFRHNIQNAPHRDYFSKLYSAGSDDYILAEREKNGWSYAPSLDILFEKKLKKEQKVQLNVIGTSIRDISNSLYREYDNKDKDLTHVQSDVESEKQSVWGEALYDKAFKNIVLSTGIRHYQMYAHTQYCGTSPVTSFMQQMNSSAFFDLQGKIKSFGYLVSLGGMRSYFKEGNEGHAYYLFIPSVRVNFVPYKDSWIQYSFNSGSTVPTLGSLTNVEQLVDSIQIQRGNPYLKTYRTYTNSIMYTYNKPKFASVLQLSHSYFDNPVMEEYFVENNKLICTERNQYYFQSFSANTSWIFRNIKLWGVTLGTNININFKRFWSKGFLYNHAYSSFYLRGQLEVGYKDFLFYTSYWTNNSSLWGETISKGENRIDYGIIYTHKKLQALVGIMYPFVNNYKVGTERVSSVASVTQWSYTNVMRNLVMMSIRYNFEFGKKFENRNKKASYNDTDSGILSRQ